jgi:hypothetical protein
MVSLFITIAFKKTVLLKNNRIEEGGDKGE